MPKRNPNLAAAYNAARKAGKYARSRERLARDPRSAQHAIDAYLVAADAFHEVGDDDAAARMMNAAQRVRDAAAEVAGLLTKKRWRGRAESEDDPVRVVFRVRKHEGRLYTEAAILDTYDHRGEVTIYDFEGHSVSIPYFMWVDDTRPATVVEYAPLLRAMSRIGYEVELGKRLPRPSGRSVRGNRY